MGNEQSQAAPQVSIIIPSYKTAPLIAACLDSILAQTFQDFEAIVVNDGSPDTAELEKVLQPYLDRNLIATLIASCISSRLTSERRVRETRRLQERVASFWHSSIATTRGYPTIWNRR